MRMDNYQRGSLQSVEASLPNLQELTITWCPKLKRLHLDAAWLRRLNLSGCAGLEELDCTGLSSLKELRLNLCSSLTALSSLPTSLQSLIMRMDNYQRGSLQSVEASLPNLQELTITWCPKLKRLHLDAAWLRRLNLSGCAGLEELDCTGLSSLKELRLNLCSSLTALSSLPTSLQSLIMRMDNYQRGSLQSVEASLPNLQELTITWCPKLKRLHLDAAWLRRLNLSGCAGLEELDCTGLPCLEEVHLDYCLSLKNLSVDPMKLERLSFFYELD
ncbi:hypothetical protein KP509_08G007000 [Ceratopteris richardii]|uniref:Uncharacterized protein n=1 Tax=Ceratopteris richardii TaxID=49495 RepID=A0A8T2U9N9_CERRI|nr:hypothetical protein KP509_08G007000 [Ceratopteris richardii]